MEKIFYRVAKIGRQCTNLFLANPKYNTVHPVECELLFVCERYVQ